jgi:hypothetical protein
MKAPIEFAIRAPAEKQIEHARFWWNFTDRLFKLVQWLFFLSLLIYARTKISSVPLSILIVVLFFAVFKTFTSSYEQYFGFNVSAWVQNKWVAFIIGFVLTLIFAGVSIYFGLLIISSLVDAFLKFQVGK